MRFRSKLWQGAYKKGAFKGFIFGYSIREIQKKADQLDVVLKGRLFKAGLDN